MELRISGPSSVFAGTTVGFDVEFRRAQHPGSPSDFTQVFTPSMIKWVSVQLVSYGGIHQAKMRMPTIHTMEDSVSGNMWSERSRHIRKELLVCTQYRPVASHSVVPLVASQPLFFARDTAVPSTSSAPGYRYHIKIALPSDLPPSWRGPYVSYSTVIMLCVSIFKGDTQIIRIPLRVYNISTLSMSIPLIPYPPDSSIEIAAILVLPDDIKNTDLGSSTLAHTTGDRLKILASIDAQTKNALELAIHGPSRSFNLGEGQFAVGTLVLPRSLWQVGEEIYGWFDFSQGQILVTQTMVRLMVLDEPESSITLPGVDITPMMQVRAETSRLISMTQAVTTHLTRMEWCLEIPPFGPPATFSTPLGKVTWGLVVDLIVAPDTRIDTIAVESDSTTRFVPPNTRLQGFSTWIPITVATSSLFDSQCSTSQMIRSFIIPCP